MDMCVSACVTSSFLLFPSIFTRFFFCTMEAFHRLIPHSPVGQKNPVFTHTLIHKYQVLWVRVISVKQQWKAWHVCSEDLGKASPWYVFQAWQWAAAELTALQTATRSLCLLCVCERVCFDFTGHTNVLAGLDLTKTASAWTYFWN